MHIQLLLLGLITVSMSTAFPSPVAPINRRPRLPPAQPNPDQHPMSSSSSASTQQILSDVLPLSKNINIFASFVRDTSVSSRLDSHDSNTTVLAPLNSAVTALPRKPWEDPKEYDAFGTSAYEGEEGEGRAARNLRRFVEAHVVPCSPWGKGEKVKSLAGGEVWWEEDAEGTKRVMPGGVEVQEIGRKVGNGEVWVLKGVLNYA